MFPFIGMGGGDDGAPYEIARSLLFDRGSSAAITRVPSSVGDRRTWTYSAWIKRGRLGLAQELLSTASGVPDTNTFSVIFRSADDTIQISADGTELLRTSQVFRDPAAWYHIVVALNTTGAAANRLKLYVNGQDWTSGNVTSTPGASTQYAVNLVQGHEISIDGCMAEVHFVDGQALDPSSFGEVSTATGQWLPKRFGGSHGANGFYLPFDNDTSTTTLGADASGNSNNWTLTGFATTDSVTDTPTDNFCVLNSLVPSSVTYSEGNLRAVVSANESTKASFGLDSGKGYFEVTVNTSGNTYIGICSSAAQDFTGFNPAPESVLVNTGGDMYGANVHTGFDGLPGIVTNDVIGVAFDVTNKRVWFSKNGQWYSANAAAESAIATSVVEAGNSGYDFSAWTGDTIFPAIATSTTANNLTVNFGQRPFVYTPPSGFQALSTKNLADPLIAQPKHYFDTVLWTGDGSAKTVAELGFQPDFVWIKNRSAAQSHAVFDAVRGAGQSIETDTTDIEATRLDLLSSLQSGGFHITGTNAQTNGLNNDYVAWCLKEGVTPGFDIVAYTGDGVAGRTIAHGLGDAPAMMIVKNRNAAGNSWAVYHRGVASDPETDALFLNSSGAASDNVVYWNDTAPTSTVFTLGAGGAVNEGASRTYIAYLWAEVPGFSKFGSYRGNQSADGPFLWCGFRPAFVLFKRVSAAGAWYMHDAARSPGNDVDETLYPHLNNAEFVWTTGDWFDFLSNGIKIRNTTPDLNSSIYDYIFAAFAEHPFKYANAR